MSSRFPNKYVIGLTGNIGVGKSVVRQMLQHLGAYTIDADGLGHQAMQPGAPAYKPVVEAFGQFIVGEDKRINRQALANMVFGHPEALKKLEAITHPIIRQAINTLTKRAKQKVVVIEAIKLLEGDLKDSVDAVWVVNATPQTQYKRLVGKRKMSPDDAKRRILAQTKQADKVSQANVVIQNDGSVEDTWKQVQLQWGEVRKALVQQAGGDASVPVVEEEAPTKVDTSGLLIKRGMPSNAQLIADFISSNGSSKVERMDVMMSFGQKSYLLVQKDEQNVVALMGWTVENLVTRMDEFYIQNGADIPSTVKAAILAIEDASKELQSEVAFLFLAEGTSPETLKAFQANEYAPITLKDIKIPAWREAVEETVKQRPMTVLWKQLRQDRVLQPI